MVPLPNKKCVADNPANPHYCLLAEHLVRYIETPLVVEESLYDLWQGANVLQIPCMWRYNLSDCEGDQLLEVQKFKARKVTLLQQAFAYRPTDRVVWGISCPFHGFSNYGEIDNLVAKRFTVPQNSENSIGTVSHWLLYQSAPGSYIDSQVDWPDNTPCNKKKA